jgi:hypothetical protein
VAKHLKIILTALISVSCLLACSTTRTEPMEAKVADETGFSFFEKDFLLVKVTINGSIEANFIIDTGIGITVISKSLCKKINCVVKGEHTGKRMSGQSVRIPMSSVQSIALAGKTENGFPVGIFDVEALMPGSNIDGFLSLGFFKNFPHTVVYSKNVIRFETEESLKRVREKGVVVNVSPDQQGDSFGVFMPLVLPNKETIKAEVDTGSQSLILHERYMGGLGVKKTAPSVKRKEGKDETGHSYVRYYSSVKGPIHLVGAENMKMESPSVMFQKIIYDGLVGFYFLREFDVTYDLRNLQMVFNKHGN